jgi:hypothetical protein
MNGEERTRTVPTHEVRSELERAIMDAAGIVALEVRRPRQAPVRARLAQITWAAVWDALALDPEDEETLAALEHEGDRASDAKGDDRAQRSAATWAEVQSEIVRARARFPALHSAHEGLGVLLEEVREVEDQVFETRGVATGAALRAELIQVAAVALRMAEDLGL